MAADLVNTEAYRPLHLFREARREGRVQYSFDCWAFGCVVFDVLQRHPRSRGSDGRLLRLFHHVDMKSDLQAALRLRNYRLAKMLDRDVVVLVVRLQPDRAVRACDDVGLCADFITALGLLVPR